jgi:hypothetical protein
MNWKKVLMWSTQISSLCISPRTAGISDKINWMQIWRKFCYFWPLFQQIDREMEFDLWGFHINKWFWLNRSFWSLWCLQVNQLYSNWS